MFLVPSRNTSYTFTDNENNDNNIRMPLFNKIRNAFTGTNDVRYCLIVGAVTLIMSVSFYQGMRATDDMGYAQLASQLLKHGATFNVNEGHHLCRIGVNWPLAFIFLLFGISDFSLALMPITCTVFTSIILYFIGKKLFDTSVGLVAGFLFALFPLTLTYGSFLVPEPMVGFELSLAAVLFLRSEDHPSEYLNISSLSSGLLIGIAYLTTEAGAVMLPALLLYHIMDRKTAKSDWSLVMGFFTIILLEMLFYYHFTGNPAFRFTLPAFSGGFNNDPMIVYANKHILWRLFWAYPAYFITPLHGLFFFGPLLFVGLLSGLVKYRKNMFLLAWALTILLFHNFMPIQFVKYTITVPLTRYIYPACLPLLVLSAASLINFWRWIKNNKTPAYIVLKICYILSVIFIVSVSILAVYFISGAGAGNVAAKNAKSAATFLKTSNSVTLISDKRTLKAISFYRGFSDLDNLIDFENFQTIKKANKTADLKVIVNGPIYNIEKNATVCFTPNNKELKNIMEKTFSPYGQVEYYYKYSKGPIYEKIISWDELYGHNIINNSLSRAGLYNHNSLSHAGWIIILSQNKQKPS